RHSGSPVAVPVSVAASTSATAKTTSTPTETPPTSPVAVPTPTPAVVMPRTPTPAANGGAAGQYTITSGYTVNQMNKGNDNSSPFMGPEPSPARGSVAAQNV